MEPLSEKWIAAQAADVLAELVGVSAVTTEVRHGPIRFDLVIRAAGQTFLVEISKAKTAGQIFEKARWIAEAARGRGIPIIVVPFMGEAGKAACERAGVSWFDLSGNARIIAPGFRVIFEGRPNQFRRRGRPASVFAPKSSRVARFLLMHPHESWTQRQIAHATEVSEGFVSRIVARLEEDRYIVRDERRALRVREPQILFEAWREEYRFSRHTIIKGHVAARSGAELSSRIAGALDADGIPYAATGLAGAWQITHFAAFRTATFYLGKTPNSWLTEKVGFRQGEQGANLWLVLPNDEGVFHGSSDHNGIRCAHPLQIYLDLQEHPERSSEAAERIQAEYLNW